MQINPYLHLDGTTKEAMNFYQQCFGGELSLTKVSESPMKEKTPKENWDKIMHSAFMKDGKLLLMAADMMDPSSFKVGDNFTVSVDCSSREEIDDLFGKLSKGGKVTHPLSDEFWGGVYGSLTDKFGIDWMFNFQKKK